MKVQKLGLILNRVKVFNGKESQDNGFESEKASED